MGKFSVPEPNRPWIDPSEFDDPFFGGEKKEPKPNVYMELSEEQSEEKVTKPVVASELSPEEIGVVFSKISKRTHKDPKCELTQQEASLLYQVDNDLSEKYVFYRRNDVTTLQEVAKGILLWRGLYHKTEDEIRQLRDYEQVKSLIIERLRSEKYVHETYGALNQVVDGLGLNPAEYTQERFVQALIEKMNEWQERGVFDYLTIELIKNKNRHNLVPVPNKEFEVEKLFALAKKFAENKQFPKFHNHYYEQYSLSDLNGPIKDPSQPIRLILMPSKLKSEFEGQKLEQQRTVLDHLKTSSPNLNFQVPSLFETIAFWYVLRSHKYALDNLTVGELFAKTSVRHFNLDAKPNGIWSAIPVSYLLDGNNPDLSYSDSEIISSIGARISVG